MKLSLFKSIALLAVASSTNAGAADENRKDVHVLLYENDPEFEQDPTSSLYFFKERSKIANLHTTVFGGKLQHPGFGDKLLLLKPLLEVVDPDQLIIVADAREVALNVPDDKEAAVQAVDRFLKTYHKITSNAPSAVVMSAEDHCCRPAMSHAAPGDYFDASTGSRKERACSSGTKDCTFEDNSNIVQWQEFMKQMALDRTAGNEEYDSVYLNEGIVAGYPQDLIKMLDMIDLESSEDDQAILTGLMYSFPDMIVLDYHQELFGNNLHSNGVDNGCLYEQHVAQQPLYHSEKMTQPLILQTPNRFYQCLDTLIESLGGKSHRRYLHSVDSIIDFLRDEGASNPFMRAYIEHLMGQRENDTDEMEEEEAKEETEEDSTSNYYDSYGNYGYGGYGNYGYGNYANLRRKN